MQGTLEDLLDERDVVATQVRYATALDARDWALLRTCFTPDAVAEYEGKAPCQGYEAIEAVCRRALTPLSRSQHLVGNHVVVLDADEATAQCYLQAQHVRPDAVGGANFIIAGCYRDHLRRTPEGWRLSRRRLETWWTEGNPAVVGR
jgi:hypothetical protein